MRGAFACASGSRRGGEFGLVLGGTVVGDGVPGGECAEDGLAPGVEHGLEPWVSAWVVVEGAGFVVRGVGSDAVLKDAVEGDGAPGAFGAGGAVDEDGLVGGVGGDAEGVDVGVGVAGAVAEEGEAVACDAECVGCGLGAGFFG